MKKVGWWTLFRVFVRSFFLQGSFSAKYRQSLGFAYAIEPVGRCLWSDPEDFHRFMVRHTENYNGNPFMATLVLGAVARMEEQLRNGEGVSEEDIRRFKKIVAPATGSAGDRLFWSNLRPAALVTGVSCALAFGWWGAVLFLALFNTAAWYLKYRWLYKGYSLGPKVVIEIRNQVLDGAERILESLGCAFAGFASVGLAVALSPGTLSRGTLLAGAFGVFLFSLALYRRNIQLHVVISCALAFAVILGMITFQLA